MWTHPIFESDFDCLTDMSGTLLKEINDRLAKMPFLGGYELGDEDKKVLAQIDNHPFNISMLFVGSISAIIFSESKKKLKLRKLARMKLPSVLPKTVPKMF